jgi:hypothetical protein
MLTFYFIFCLPEFCHDPTVQWVRLGSTNVLTHQLFGGYIVYVAILLCDDVPLLLFRSVLRYSVQLACTLLKGGMGTVATYL